MNREIYARLYKILERITPLSADCGDLCQKKCCSSREEGQGVYLFPGEEKLFPGGEGWYLLSEYGPGASYFTGDQGFMLNCSGRCPRERRPLACRLFPLAPHLNGQGALEIVLDSDALFICPLVRSADIGLLAPAFREGVQRIWSELVKNPLLGENVQAYSARIDRQKDDPWTSLLGGRL